MLAPSVMRRRRPLRGALAGGDWPCPAYVVAVSMAASGVGPTVGLRRQALGIRRRLRGDRLSGGAVPVGDQGIAMT